jgi:phage-related minor tail protein
MSREQIAEVTDTQGIDSGIKRAFVDLARLRRILADKQTAEAELKTRVQALTSDQSRIRDNISRIDRDSPLYKRYLEKLSTQESDFEALQVAAEKAAGETREASAAVDSFIAGLTI